MPLQDDLYLPKATGAPAPSRVRAGFAEADITPTPGMETPGGYVKAYSHSVHDPCKVRVAVLEDKRVRVALVSVDALIIPSPLAEKSRTGIAAKCGIPPERVIIAATHSHSSGPVGMIQPGEFDHASPLVQKLAYELSSCADVGYLKHVEQQIVSLVVRASSGLQPAWLSFGKGCEDKVAFNRRFRMKNGSTVTHPGRGHPDIIEPAGPIDPEVGVLGAWNERGELIGCIVNYACHATTNPDGFSANWIFYMEEVIRNSLADDAVVLFFQGASGDVTQVNNLSPFVEPDAEQSARRVGGSVGAEAVKVLLMAEPGGEIVLGSAVKHLRIARRIPSPKRVQQSLEIVQRQDSSHSEWAFAKEILLLDALLAKGHEVNVELQAIQIGPAVFLSTPAEVFAEWGLNLKRQSLFPFTWPVELANGIVGYVPTEEAMGPRGGGYETRLTCYSNLVPDASRQMLDAAMELINKVTPGPSPEAQKAPPATATWSYGTTPPQLE